MDAAFERAIAPFRRELLAHCYRLTGSIADAEDALQDSLLRAWRGYAEFEGRSSLRTWLYRVTTNTCLNALAAKRARSLPHASLPLGSPDDETRFDLEPVWLEPFPDALIEDGPEAAYSRREAVRLAFVVALQQLPPRQRAVLMLRDVVALSAEETATVLELSVAATNSLLQRAREQMGERPQQFEASEELLARYVEAWESEDANAFIALLREDAIASMPPSLLWVQGRAEVIACMRKLVWTGPRLALRATRANDAPAFGIYQERGGEMVFAGLSVLDVRADGIASVHSFLAVDPRLDPARFGLTSRLLP